MMETQVQALLSAPPAEQQGQLYAQLTSGLGLEVRLDAGGGKGKGIFATQAFLEGQLLFKELPLAAIQHTASRAEAWVCAHCLRFIGGVEQQVARMIMAVREAAEAEEGSEAASDGDGSDGDGGSEGDNGSMQREAALALTDSQLQALADGSLKLPHTEAVQLPTPVRCPGSCCEEWYCSSGCADAAWQQYHQLLCVGPEEEEEDHAPAGTASKGKGAAAPTSAGHRGEDDDELQQQREALREFLHHADSTNDVFRLAANVVARVLLAAQQQLEGAAATKAGGSSGSRGGCSGAAHDKEACWRALLAAWQPFAVGHKGLWWECTAAPPQAAADMRQLAADSLELLCAALPAHLRRRFPALLTLPVWGSIIGMFELNNLESFVASPVKRWLDLLDGLPEEEQARAYAAAAPFTDALPEDVPGCEGNAFYALHSCCNHSCVPNAEAFKRDEDDDGSAVILALRDIAAGEEVMLSYIDEEAPLEERQEQLADYGFTCACHKCAAQK